MELTSLFAPQNRRLITLTTPAKGEHELLLEQFSGTEGLSTLFSFELSLISQDARLELKSLIGQPALLAIELARYSATLSPWLWMLSRRHDSRIFQEQTIEDIIRTVFAHYEALPGFEFRLDQALKSHSYITQYRESDLDFVLRLLEGEGLFFYFDHSREGHQLIITDHSRNLEPLPQQPQIRFHSASVTETADAITQWSSNRVLQSGRMAIQTFDYRQPRNPLPVSMPSLNVQGEVPPYEIYDFPGHYSHGIPADGETLVRHRLEAMEVQGKTFQGTSSCRAMLPGWVFVQNLSDRIDVEVVRNRWNQGKEPDEQTHAFRRTAVSGIALLETKDHYRYEREETPNEIRARMDVDPDELSENSYHSAVLRSPENHRWVTAMDIAIGQAKCELGNVDEGYDIGRRLGNTGVSGALVEINLATIASYLEGGVSAVVYSGKDGSTTVQMIRPPDEARKAKNQQTHGVDPFRFRMPGR
jgi:uncharacterized protein involved in type VI secretion and phage assembly